MVAGAVYAAGVAVSAAVSYIGGASASAASQAEADRRDQYALQNAIAEREWGQQQAELSTVTAMFNSMMMMQQTERNIDANNAVVEYNTSVLEATQAYNSMLAAEEIASVYDAANLSDSLAHRAWTEQIGTTQASLSASGTVMNQDSNRGIVIQMMADEALDRLVIGHNADISAASIANAEAQGQWQTDMEIQRLTYEGEIANADARYSGYMQSATTLFNGAMDANNAVNSGNNAAQSTLWTGQQESSNLRAQADTQMTSGILSAGSTAVRGYLNSPGGGGSVPDTTTTTQVMQPTVGSTGQYIYPTKSMLVN